MKVKIIKAEKPGYWYASKIGKIVEVEESSVTSDFRLVSSSVEGYFISKTDCVVLSNTEALQYDLEEAKSRVVELEKLVAEERAKEAAKPFTQEQYEKVVAEYRACKGRKKFEKDTNHFVLNINGGGYIGWDNWMDTQSAAPFGVFFDTSTNISAAIDKVGAENLRKAWEYEMNIGLEGK